MSKFIKQFFKYFFAVLIFQIVFVAVFLFAIPTAIGEYFAIFFYVVPWMLILTETGEKKELSNFLMAVGIGLPASIYSVILSLAILGLKKVFKNISFK